MKLLKVYTYVLAFLIITISSANSAEYYKDVDTIVAYSKTQFNKHELERNDIHISFDPVKNVSKFQFRINGNNSYCLISDKQFKNYLKIINKYFEWCKISMENNINVWKKIDIGPETPLTVELYIHSSGQEGCVLVLFADTEKYPKTMYDGIQEIILEDENVAMFQNSFQKMINMQKEYLKTGKNPDELFK
ncbi:MAG: hypothetical protein WC188_03185 [Candidatus Caldatribacteriota bacterium]|jgi:hypothetical protein